MATVNQDGNGRNRDVAQARRLDERPFPPRGKLEQRSRALRNHNKTTERRINLVWCLQDSQQKFSRHSGQPRIVVRGSASRKETRGKLDYRFRVMTQRRADLLREFLRRNPTFYRNRTFASSDRYFSVSGWSDPRTSKI